MVVKSSAAILMVMPPACSMFWMICARCKEIGAGVVRKVKVTCVACALARSFFASATSRFGAASHGPYASSSGPKGELAGMAVMPATTFTNCVRSMSSEMASRTNRLLSPGPAVVRVGQQGDMVALDEVLQDEGTGAGRAEGEARAFLPDGLG